MAAPCLSDVESRRTLGRYALVAPLGSGGMGDVHLAVMRGPNHFRKVCVLKCLRSEAQGMQRARELFSKEAFLAARLNHPNIVQTYETGEADGLPFMAMEHLEGQTMRGLLGAVQQMGIRPEPAFWVRIVADALRGLHHAHELRDVDGTPLGVVHRDISPHNIFVTYEGRVCVIDFGAAKLTFQRGRAECRTLTGKLGYMAPEYVTGSEIDRRADIFSMGVVLWEALTHRKMPHAGLTPSECCQVRPSAGGTEHRVDPRLSAIVARALAIDPASRYPTAAAMRDALEEWLERGHEVRTREVGAFVSACFAEERDRMDEALREHMEALPRDVWVGSPSDANLDAMVGSDGVLPGVPAGPPTKPARLELICDEEPPRERETVFTRRRRNRAALVASLTFIAAAAGAGTLFVLR
jgi:serine/threonine protein kinase